MVVLVDCERHIFHLGDSEVYCGMGSDTVSYWLQRRARGARWRVLARNEGERARTELETLPAYEVRRYVDEELGLGLSDEDWAEMGWSEELAERVLANEPPPPPPPSPVIPTADNEEDWVEMTMFPIDPEFIRRLREAALAKRKEEKRRRR